jgi:hypothetical protein
MHLIHSTDTPSPVHTWAIGGARKLNTAGVRLAESVALALLDGGARLACGCATGADAAVLHVALQAQMASRLSVWTAFGPASTGPGGAAALTPGTWRWSAPAAVALAGQAGAQVHPWAGGGAEVPLQARLARRTRAVAGAATKGAVVLLHPRSAGALLLAREAARRGLPVLALPIGCDPEALPALDGSGAWEPACWCRGVTLPGAVRWRAAQAALL